MDGRVVKVLDADKGLAVLQLMQKNDAGAWEDIPEKMAPVKLFGDPVAQADAGGQAVEVRQGRSIAIVYAKGSSDEIIPTYILSAMPKWFGLIFLTLLSAAMSTLSSQFHTVGTSIGRDVYEQITGRQGQSTLVIRVGIILGIIYAVLISFYARESTFIARATAIFFGLCASAFLPAFIGALYFRGMTKAAAIWSMIIGFLVTAFWLVFVKAAEAQTIGLVQKVTGGKTSILAGRPNWDVVDPIVIALPISILVAILVSFFTKSPSKEHLDKCFQGV